MRATLVKICEWHISQKSFCRFGSALWPAASAAKGSPLPLMRRERESHCKVLLSPSCVMDSVGINKEHFDRGDFEGVGMRERKGVLVRENNYPKRPHAKTRKDPRKKRSSRGSCSSRRREKKKRPSVGRSHSFVHPHPRFSATATHRYLIG